MKWGISMLKWSDIFRKNGFYCLWFFDNHRNLWGGPQDLHRWLQNTVAASKERKLLYSSGIHQKSVILIIVASWWLQSWNLKNLIPLYMFAKGLVEEPCTLMLIVCPYLHVSYLTRFLESAVLGCKLCSVCEFCYSNMYTYIQAINSVLIIFIKKYIVYYNVWWNFMRIIVVFDID